MMGAVTVTVAAVAVAVVAAGVEGVNAGVEAAAATTADPATGNVLHAETTASPHASNVIVARRPSLRAPAGDTSAVEAAVATRVVVVVDTVGEVATTVGEVATVEAEVAATTEGRETGECDWLWGYQDVRLMCPSVFVLSLAVEVAHC